MNYTRKLREGGWAMFVDTEKGYGYFEHDVVGDGGGLWFRNRTLTDFDGRHLLPVEVQTALRRDGFFVSDDFV